MGEWCALHEEVGVVYVGVSITHVVKCCQLVVRVRVGWWC